MISYSLDPHCLRSISLIDPTLYMFVLKIKYDCLRIKDVVEFMYERVWGSDISAPKLVKRKVMAVFHDYFLL